MNNVFYFDELFFIIQSQYTQYTITGRIYVEILGRVDYGMPSDGGTGVYYLSQRDQTISQPTLTIETGTIEKKAVAVGNIVPAHSVSIKSQNNGIVGEIYVKVGEKVKQGQALIKVSPNPTPRHDGRFNGSDALSS